MWLHHGCFWVDRAFPWSCLGELERRMGGRHGEKREEWQKIQVQWSNLLAFTERQNNHNYNYYRSHSSAGGWGRKKYTGAHLILNEYLVLDSSYLSSSAVDCLAWLHSHFCCIWYRAAAPTLTRCSMYINNPESWIWQTFVLGRNISRTGF